MAYQKKMWNILRIGKLITLLHVLAGGEVFAGGEKTLTSDGRSLPGTHTYLLQYQHGRASDSDFWQGLLFYYEEAEEHTYLNALSLGIPVQSRLKRWQIDVAWYVGFQQFAERGFQSDSYGVSVYPKFFKPFKLPYTDIALRAGFGLGLSYVSRIPVVEQRDFEPEKSAKLSVYIDYTIQYSLKRQLGLSSDSSRKSIADVYLSYSIVHRSTAFGLFAETGGGINYMGIGLEFELR